MADQRRLIEHFYGDNPCILRGKPTAFAFELTPGVTRLPRHAVLTQELSPACVC